MTDLAICLTSAPRALDRCRSYYQFNVADRATPTPNWAHGRPPDPAIRLRFSQQKYETISNNFIGAET
jgi:hypothetical protein